MDHVMEISAPELFEKVSRSVDDLLASAGTAQGRPSPAS